jgi:hypothetical protein
MSLYRTNNRTLVIDSTDGSARSALYLYNNGVSKGELYLDSAQMYLSSIANIPLAFRTNAIERMRILTDGNIGIGTAFPSRKLEIMGNVGIGTTADPYTLKVNNVLVYNGEFNNGNSSTSLTIDWNKGNKQRTTLTGNCTFTFTAPTTGVANLMLKLIQDGTGSRTVTWPATVKWPGGSAPTLTTTATTGIDIVSCYWDGTNYFCSTSLDFR